MFDNNHKYIANYIKENCNKKYNLPNASHPSIHQYKKNCHFYKGDGRFKIYFSFTYNHFVNNVNHNQIYLKIIGYDIVKQLALGFTFWTKNNLLKKPHAYYTISQEGCTDMINLIENQTFYKKKEKRYLEINRSDGNLCSISVEKYKKALEKYKRLNADDDQEKVGYINVLYNTHTDKQYHLLQCYQYLVLHATENSDINHSSKFLNMLIANMFICFPIKEVFDREVLNTPIGDLLLTAKDYQSVGKKSTHMVVSSFTRKYVPFYVPQVLKQIERYTGVTFFSHTHRNMNNHMPQKDIKPSLKPNMKANHRCVMM